MSVQPTLNYFSIWRASFRLAGSYAGSLCRWTLLLAAPLFLIDGIANANHMLTLGVAAMSGSEIPVEQMRRLWGSLVGASSLVWIGLASVGWVGLAFLRDARPGEPEGGLRHELAKLIRRPGFWVFVVSQPMIFAMIHTPDGRFKLSGMALLACGLLLLWGGRDDAAFFWRRRRLRWAGWLNLACVMFTFPVLYIALNGYVSHFLLLLADLVGQQLMQLFPPESPALPFGIIALSRFLAQWLNLLPMLLLASTYLAIRGMPSTDAQ